ncbi:MAG: trypsin-like peptidase domain-containing protein [Pseudonocardiaceae bacterium]
MTHSWRLRVTDLSAGTCGAGVLIGSGEVLTCAHVVGGHGEGPTVDFPGSASDTRVSTRVTHHIPPAEDGRGDLAILALDEPLPPDVQPARLGRGETSVGHAVQAFGHPPHLFDGVWTRGTVLGSAGPGAEWMQLSGVTLIDERVTPGFSGAGVFDVATDCVIGVVVASYLVEARHVAWMIPTEVAGRYLPPLQRRLLDGTPTPVELSAEAIWRVAEKLASLRTMIDPGTRRQIVESLPSSVALRIQRHSAVLPDVHAIVVACLEYDGALTALRRAVRRLEGPSRRMREFDVVLNDLGVGVTR